MSVRTVKKGFTLVELLVSMVIILFLGIALARGILELLRLDMRIKARQTAQQVVQSWASYIQALPFDSWVINPGEQDCQDPAGTGCHAFYCYDCSHNRSFCDKDKRRWTGWSPNNPPPPICDDSDCYYCYFMDPTVWTYNMDEDNIINLYDPYQGNNDCNAGQATCDDENMKYLYPSWYLAGHLRFAPDWGQGSDDCACRLGNCPQAYRIGNPWTSYDGPDNYTRSYNYRIGKQYLNNLKCTYQVGKSGGVAWEQAPGNKVYVGISVINYAHLKNPTAIVGKAVGIIAWYFDPIDKRYRAYTKIVFKERQ